MKVDVGDTIVIVATNKDGSVNGKQFRVSGILDSVTGPGGRDGYIHIEDAMETLRMEEMEISEVALRLKDFGQLNPLVTNLNDSSRERRTRRENPFLRSIPGKNCLPFSTLPG